MTILLTFRSLFLRRICTYGPCLSIKAYMQGPTHPKVLLQLAQCVREENNTTKTAEVIADGKN